MKIGDRVSIKATAFDDPGDQPADRWSRLHFPQTWRVERLHGEIIAVAGRQKFTVRWDYDRTESDHHRRALEIVDGMSQNDDDGTVSASDESDDDFVSDADSEDSSPSVQSGFNNQVHANAAASNGDEIQVK
jgi:hypothetical protein